MTQSVSAGSGRARWAFPLIIAGLSMLGPFTVDTIFPGFADIQRDLHVGPEATQQLVSVYLLTFGAMSLFHGPLSDALGRRRVILGSLLVYLLASVGCALSGNIFWLLFFRAWQGLSAGGSVIVGRTLVVDLYSGVEAERLMSRVTMIFALAPALAPVVGGWLLGLGRWPLVFWFLAGLAALLVAMALVLPETHPRERRTPLRVRALMASVLEVARDRTFVRLSLAAAFGFASFFTWIGAAAIFVVDLLGLGERDFWVLFVPLIAAIIGGSWLSGRAAGRGNRQRLVTAAYGFSVLAAVANVLATLWAPTARLPYVVIGPALIALGVMSVYPGLQVMLLELYPRQRGAATSVATMMALALNAFVAGVLAPLTTRSLTSMALTGGTLAVLALLTWAWHLRIARITSAGEGTAPAVR